MPPDPSGAAAVRSADAVNDDIRALVRDAGRRLTDEERAVYEQLLLEWAAAVRAEIVAAA